MEQTHIAIDAFNFNIESVCKSTEAEFIAQYTDQRPYGISPDDWSKWMKDAYKSIIANGKVEEKRPGKNGVNKVV